MPSSKAYWDRLVARCLHSRVSPAQFGALAETLHEKVPLAGYQLSKILFEYRLVTAFGVDPLAPLYIEEALKLGLVDGQDALLSNETSHGLANRPDCAYNSQMDFDEAILNVLIEAYASGNRPRSARELQQTLELLSNRISAVASANTQAMMDPNVFHQPSQQELYLREAFGILLVAILESPSTTQMLDTALSYDQANHVAQCVSAFVSVLAGHAIPLANRLDALRKSHERLRLELPASYTDGSNENLIVAHLELNGFMDVSEVRSRASLFVYLDFLLTGAPFPDDASIISYLEARYKDDVQTLFTDLVTASFDVLTAAINRGDTLDRMFLIRSFLTNKLPILLRSVSVMSFVPVNVEFLLQQAFGRLGSTAFPTYSHGFDFGAQDGASLESRLQFLSSCVVRGLITQDSVERLLGSQAAQAPPGIAKITKETLVAEYNSDSRTLARLIHTMEAMDGNVSIVSNALVEILHNLWASRDTMSLKTFCNLLSRRPLALDAMLLFVSPSSLLLPLCRLIDNWKYEDDHGEYQPIYDEFSSCLLLVLVIYNRYDLKITDLGLVREQSFVCRLIERGCESTPMEALTADGEKQFAGWIHGLFDTEGISDDLMSTCPPQDFYTLVPALFEQSITACRLKHMSIDSLRSSLELLLETFLLPSLIPALQWLGKQPWDREGEIDIIVQVLHKLTSPASLHGEGQPMHGTVLAVMGKSLTILLRSIQQREPARQDVDSLIKKLSPYLDYCRTIPSQRIDMSFWNNEQLTGTLTHLSQTLNNLCFWSSPMVVSCSHPTYTYKQLSLALQLVGAVGVLNVMLEVCKAQSKNGLEDDALDVVATLVCLSYLQQNSFESPLSLRTALLLEVQRASNPPSDDVSHRNIAMKLSHRVEAQLVGVQVARPNIAVVIPGVLPESVTTQLTPLLVEEENDQASDSFLAVNGIQMDLSTHNEQEDFGQVFNDMLVGNEDDIFDGLALDDDVDIT